jgi:hypothetical protein
LKSVGLEFWTSGSNEGDFCDTLNVNSWCSLNETLLLPEFFEANGNMSLYRNVTSGNKTLERCLALNLNGTNSERFVMEHSMCNKTNFYICEVFLNLTMSKLECIQSTFQTSLYKMSQHVQTLAPLM